MATLKNQYAEIELQLGTKEYELEIQFNYTPASKGSLFEPPEAEEFEVYKVTVLGVTDETYMLCGLNSPEFNDDMIDLLNDEIIEKIKEQKEG